MISVVIPIYNVAPYLSQCIESIEQQTYTDWELILVDDGSTDESGELCNDWACRDARITVLHQPNQGAAAARNHALEVARGEYIAFIDADDVVHHRYLELLLEALLHSGADVAQFPYSIIDPKLRQQCIEQRLDAPMSNLEQEQFSGEEALLSMLYQQAGGINSSPCKLYRAEVFDQVKLPEQYRVYEDLYLLAQIFHQGAKAVQIKANVPVYFYFKEDNGTLNSLSPRRLDAFDMLETLEAQFLVQGHKPLVRAVRERRLSVAFNILRLLSRQPHTDANKAMAHRCWQHIRALRSESIHDPKARIKNRLVAALTYLLIRH